MLKSLMLMLLLSSSLTAQDKAIVTDEKTGEPMLIGICSFSDLTEGTFGAWFNSEYESYEINPEDLDGVPQRLEDVEVVIVLGTWCDDTHMLIPRLYKVLDGLFFPHARITLIAVDRQKKGIGSEADMLAIERIPTVIFYRNQSEIGRIVETIEESVEVDIASILLVEPF